ncbi:MAG: RNA polymerase sigma factor RpoD/SigA [Candidatus Latescibacterota bacterium]|nr:RNA polymerase sigma factor RpoD/SigA [Candidatus Latescibacterota bacterium]
MVRSLTNCPQPSRTCTDLDPLELYLREIDVCEPLSREREIELSRRARNGDEQALEGLVSANLRFVVSVARQFTGRGLSLLELISEGNAGLIKAAERFDGERGVKFISYAVWWIKNHIHTALGLTTGTNPLIDRPNRDFQVLKKEQRRLTQELGRELTFDEVATRSGLSGGRAERAMSASLSDLSLDAPVFENDGPRWDSLMTSAEIAADVALEQAQLHASLTAGLGQLDGREQEILNRYFGLDDEEPQRMDKIGEIMGISRERVRQLRNRALDKLRQHCGEVAGAEMVSHGSLTPSLMDYRRHCEQREA